MGLRQTISDWVTTIKEALDFGPGFPDALETRRVLFAQEAARLEHLLEETRKASQEKDQLIAKLQAVGAVAGSMVVDGPAYYIRRANTLEGPFCTSCFQRNHEIVRITAAPTPRGHDGTPAGWVQCAKCRTPFRSDRISQFLNPVRVPTGGRAPAAAPPRRDESRLGSPAGQGTEPQGRQQRTEDRRPRAQVPSHPSSVLLHPPSEPEPEPNSPPAQNPVPEMSRPTPEDASRTASPEAMPRVEASQPASAPTAAAPQEGNQPKLVKTTRKPRKEAKRATSHAGKAPTGQTGPVKDAPPAQGIATASPAPAPDTAVEAPRPSRTRARARKSKDQRSEKAMATHRSKSTP